MLSFQHGKNTMRSTLKQYTLGMSGPGIYTEHSLDS